MTLIEQARKRAETAHRLGVPELGKMLKELADAAERGEALLDAVAKHHAQKADDRCIEDDDAIYAVAGLPPCDRRVGDKTAMLANCARFITNRCESGGPWKSYAELEAEVARLKTVVAEVHEAIGESVASDDETLAEGVALRISDLKQRLHECQAALDKAMGVTKFGEKP